MAAGNIRRQRRMFYTSIRMKAKKKAACGAGGLCGDENDLHLHVLQVVRKRQLAFRERCDSLWETYCAGELDGAPVPVGVWEDNE